MSARSESSLCLGAQALSGSAGRCAQNPLPFSGMRHTRQGVALALSSATPRLISSDSEREPSVSVGRSPSTGIGEGHILQTQVVGRGASPSGLVLGLDPGSKTTGWAVYDADGHSVVAMGQLALRQDVRERMEKRKGYRRSRRSKLWYRPSPKPVDVRKTLYPFQG